MRLTPKRIEAILQEILGEDGLPLIRELIGKENVSEFDLATRTKKDIKVIRRMLYTLYNYNLVGFTRKKDKQKGWYIYYWTLLPDSIRFNYYKMKRNQVQDLQKQLEREEKELFFVCDNECVRLAFDQAVDFEFHCPECGELINQDDPEKRIGELKKKIDELTEELKTWEEQRKVRRKVVKQKKKETKQKKSVSRKKSSFAPAKKTKKKTPKKVTKKNVKKTTKKKVSKKSSKVKSVKKTIKKLVKAKTGAPKKLGKKTTKKKK